MPEFLQHETPHILIVDDEAFSRIIFRDALEGAGLAATVTPDGACAVEMVKRHRYDLILLDVLMPGIDGLETCREIRGLPDYRHTPIVMVTGRCDTASIAAAFDAGATDFITKPVNHELLVHRIRYMLRATQSLKDISLAKDRIKVLKEAVDCLPIGIGITISDTCGRIVYANSKEAEMHGYSPEELVGMEAGMLAPEQQRKPLQPEALKKVGLWERETANRRKDGQLFPVRLASLAVRDCDGRCIGIVTACEDITTKKETELKIQQLAYYDTLTQLPNRVKLLERLGEALSEARREDKTLGILFLDLDNFKDINDTLGHCIGDRLLQEVSGRIGAQLRDTDTVARIGGDEFVVLLNSIGGEEDAAGAAQRILSVFSGPIPVDGLQLYSGASIGIALFPRDDRAPEGLLKCAEAAMYHAKGEGRSLYGFFSDGINQRIRRRVALERHLREGIEKQEFFLHYQPQWDLRTGKVVGVEALLRWNNAEFGLVSPSEFIPLAEVSGFIFELGKWVIRTACVQARKWEEAGIRGLKTAVNISGKQLRQMNLVAVIGETLRDTGVAPGALELEITESVIMEKADANIATLTSLKEMGIQLSVDDFGTGYSSLSYLKHFPVDRLKIDRSFLADVNSSDGCAIVQAIITMSHSMGLKVLAEGVENNTQMDFLLDRQCNEAQGFYLAMPMHGDGITCFLQNSCERIIARPVQQRQKHLYAVERDLPPCNTAPGFM